MLSPVQQASIRFSVILRQFMAANAIDEKTLAEAFKVSPHAVREWLAARSFPGRRTIEEKIEPVIGYCEDLYEFCDLRDAVHKENYIARSAALRAKPAGNPLPEDEIGEAVLWAAGMAVSKRLFGDPPSGFDKDELRSEIMLRLLPKARRYRDTNKKTLKEFCYVSACYIIIDLFRFRKDRREDSDPLLRRGTVWLGSHAILERQMQARDTAPQQKYRKRRPPIPTFFGRSKSA